MLQKKWAKKYRKLLSSNFCLLSQKTKTKVTKPNEEESWTLNQKGQKNKDEEERFLFFKVNNKS